MVICHNSLAGQVGRIGAWLAGTPHVLYFAHGLACGPAQAPAVAHPLLGGTRMLAPCTSGIIIMNNYDENIARVGHLVGAPTGSTASGHGRGPDAFQHRAQPAARAQAGARAPASTASGSWCCAWRGSSPKGVAELVEAAPPPWRESAATSCSCWPGTGPLLEGCAPAFGRLGIERSFRVLGWRNDIHELMKCADILALPSYYMEGLPVSILEAMACGKPVVSTHHKGCEDAVVGR